MSNVIEMEELEVMEESADLEFDFEPNEEEMLKPYEVKACKKRAEEIEDYINGKLGIKSRKEWEAFVEEEKQDPDSTYYSDPANNIVPKDDWIRDFESKPRVCCIFETDVDYDSYDDDREYSYITYDYYFTLHVGCLDRDANHGRPSIYAKDIRISLCASNEEAYLYFVGWLFKNILPEEKHRDYDNF